MLGIVGILLVCVKLHDFQGQIAFQSITMWEYTAIVALSLVYGGGNLLLALAWRNLLAAFKSPVSIRWAVRTYAISLLGKYIPGNVFQFAGRQAIGIASGLRGWPLAKSTVYELSLMSVCGAVIGILVLPLFPVAVSTTQAVLLFAAGITSLLLVARLVWDLNVSAAVFCYLVFLTLSAVVFSGALAIVDHGETEIGDTSLMGAYVIAWLAGLLTPGAPAGLGVREAFLLVILSGHIADPVILQAVIVGRTITVSGDLIFYGVGHLVPSTQRFNST